MGLSRKSQKLVSLKHLVELSLYRVNGNNGEGSRTLVDASIGSQNPALLVAQRFTAKSNRERHTYEEPPDTNSETDNRPTQRNSDSDLSRREFLGRSALVAAGAGAASLLGS